MGNVFYMRKGLIHETPFAGDANTILLLHGESIEDSSIYKIPIINEGATVAKDRSKFGGGSIFFDGSARLFISPGFIFRGDFTFDWWEYLTENIYGQGNVFTAADTGPVYFQVTYHGSGVNLYAKGMQPYGDAYGGSMGTQILNQWTHRAVVRSGETIKVYENGAETLSIQYRDVIENPDNFFSIGFDKRANQPWKGYLDEFRISNIARWTSDFTPPTEPYK